MSQQEERGVIADSDILNEDYLPTEIPGRESQIKEMTLSLSPTTKGRKPVHLWLHGKPGSGKTATAKSILKKIRDESSIEGVYVNCWEQQTLYSVLDCLVTELRILRAEEQRAGTKFRKFEQYIGKKPFIVVLDEIDRTTPKERDSIIYMLCNAGNTGLICISHSREPLFSLEPRVKSRMNPMTILFSPYSVDDLSFVLNQRAESGLMPNTWKKESLAEIVELAKGDARIAIQTLKKAAHYAEQDGSGRIDRKHIRKGWNDAREIKKVYLLKKLTEDHRILCSIVKKRREIDSGRLWKEYLKKCRDMERDPIAPRTFSEYMNRLAHSSLITQGRARVKGRVRLFKPVR